MLLCCLLFSSQSVSTRMSLVNDLRIDFQSLENHKHHEYLEKVKCIGEQVQDLGKGVQTNNLMNNRGKLIQNYDSELKALLENNKQLRQDLDVKLEDLAKTQAQYENNKQDQKLLSQEVKETYTAFMTAKKYYKKFLNMYYTIESVSGEKQIIFVQFFTESKKDTDIYSVRLGRDIKTRNYELMETTPTIKTFSEVQRNLSESKDVPGTLCTIRQIFMKLKQTN